MLRIFLTNYGEIDFDITDHISAKDSKKMDPFILMGSGAFKQSRCWGGDKRRNAHRFGTIGFNVTRDRKRLTFLNGGLKEFLLFLYRETSIWSYHSQ